MILNNLNVFKPYYSTVPQNENNYDINSLVDDILKKKVKSFKNNFIFKKLTKLEDKFLKLKLSLIPYKEILQKINKFDEKIERTKNILKKIENRVNNLTIIKDEYKNYYQIFAQVNEDIVKNEIDKLEKERKEIITLIKSNIEEELQNYPIVTNPNILIDKTKNRIIEELKPELKKVQKYNVYFKHKLDKIENDAQWLKENVEEEVMPLAKYIEDLGLKDLIENYDMSKGLLENYDKAGGITGILTELFLKNKKLRNTIVGKVLRLFEGKVFDKLVSGMGTIFLKTLSEKGFGEALKKSLRFGGKNLLRLGKVVFGSKTGLFSASKDTIKGIFSLFKNGKSMPIFSTVENIPKGSFGTIATKGLSKASGILNIGKNFATKGGILAKAGGLLTKVPKGGFVNKLPLIGSLLGLGYSAYEAYKAKTDLGAKEKLGTGIGGTIGTYLGGLVGAALPIPGATLALSTAGGYLGAKVGGWLGKFFSKPDDYVPDEIKKRAKSIDELINIIDTAIHTISEKKINPFTNTIFENEEEAKNYIDNLYAYKKDLIEKKLEKEVLQRGKKAYGDEISFAKQYLENPRKVLDTFTNLQYPETKNLAISVFQDDFFKLAKEENKEKSKDLLNDIKTRDQGKIQKVISFFSGFWNKTKQYIKNTHNLIVKKAKELGNKFDDKIKMIMASMIPGAGAVYYAKKAYDKAKSFVNNKKMNLPKNFDDRMLALIRKHETGTIEGKYNIAKDIGDKAGISFGAYQFTEKSGMVKKYIQEMAKRGDNEAVKILQKMELKTLSKDELINYLQKSGSTDIGKKVQDELAKKQYLEPAKKLAMKYGVNDPKIMAMIMDHYLNAGYGGAKKVLEIAKKMGGLTFENVKKARITFYQNLANKKPEVYGKFLKGWLNRVEQNATEAQKYFNIDNNIKNNENKVATTDEKNLKTLIEMENDKLINEISKYGAGYDIQYASPNIVLTKTSKGYIVHSSLNENSVKYNKMDNVFGGKREDEFTYEPKITIVDENGNVIKQYTQSQTVVRDRFKKEVIGVSEEIQSPNVENKKIKESEVIASNNENMKEELKGEINKKYVTENNNIKKVENKDTNNMMMPVNTFTDNTPSNNVITPDFLFEGFISGAFTRG